MLLLVGAVLTPVAVLAHWARDTVTSTDGYVATAGEVAADPAVREALITHLTAATLERIDVDALVASALAAVGSSGEDSQGEALAVPLRVAIESLVRDVITQVVGSDAFAAVWSQANRDAHAAAVALLADDGGGTLSLTDDGQVSLDLGPVVDLARADLVARGITLASAIPPIDASVPLFSSQDLVQARGYYAALDAAADWMPWVAALLLISAVALARSRAAVLAWEGGVVVVVTALVSLAVVVVRGAWIETLTGSPLRTEVTVSVATILGESALGALRAGYLIGVVLVAGAVLAWLVTGVRPTGWLRRGRTPRSDPAGRTR